MRRNTLFLFFALLALFQTPSWGQGPAVGSEFQVNTYTTSDQYYPVVGVSATGAFVMVWQSLGQDGHSQGIFARRYDSTGAPLDPVEFQVNSYTTSSQARPAIAVGPAGDFVVAWINYIPSSSIFARRFDSAGTPLDPVEFQVNTYTSHGESYPAVALAPTGEFTVVWQSNPPPSVPERFGIFGRRFDSAGNALDPSQFRVNDAGNIGGYWPSIDVADSGDFVVVWDVYTSRKGYVLPADSTARATRRLPVSWSVPPRTPGRGPAVHPSA